MCGTQGLYQHSIDYDAMMDRLDGLSRKRYEDSMANLQRLAESGQLFSVNNPPPIRIEDIAYG